MKKILFLALLLCLTLCLCLSAAANTVYLNDGGTGNGASADAPMGDLAEAIQAVAGGGTIVINEVYTLAEPFTAPDHDGSITIRGGSLVFDHKSYSRFYLSGPTTFENISLVRGENNTAKGGMIIARFHPVVMGEGITTGSGLTLYVVGGYQFPITEEPEINKDASITIHSGTYNSVIGFCRGTNSTVFRSTAHITVNGGTIKNLYGASVGTSHAYSTDITVNGGTVTALHTGGDKAQRLNGNAKVTINSGTVATLDINNVMGRTDLYYLGGKITNLSTSIEETLVNKVTDGTINLIARKGQRVHDFIEAFDSAAYEDGTKISGAEDAAVAVYTVLENKTVEKSTAHPAKVYVANVGNGDGLSPETAISDLKTAYQMLEGIDGTIVLVNQVDISSGSFTEPEHENHIVITSYDGERYFDGGLYTGNGKRFYCKGNTTFENTKITYEKSVVFAANFNDMTLGTGLETVRTDSTASQFLVLGGYQTGTVDNAPTDVHGTLTVESGNYYCIIGYTRGSSATQMAFTGTQTINFFGGSVVRIYGGPAQAHSGDNVVLNIGGSAAVTDYIQVGGDQFFYSNNATINMTGGHINKLDMHNVIGTTTLNWTDGTIGTMLVSYGAKADGSIDVAPLATNATYTLEYKENVFPTAEQLALFNTVRAAVTEIKLTIASTTAYVNGVEKTLDAEPIIYNDRTMLPIRFVAENLGATVGWDGNTRTVLLTTDLAEIKITIDSATATVNGEAITLDAPAFIQNDRTYLPVRFVAENLGATVGWDGNTRTVTLTK